jgi:predicted metal-dependent phosphoesterase TrpH
MVKTWPRILLSRSMAQLLNPVAEIECRLDAAGAPFFRRREGARFDLHCHSTFSDERLRFLPGLVYHPLLEPEQVYDLAKRRGMDFVTLTDHDTIDGCKALIDRRGPLADFVFGEEVSVAFPEDGTIIHVNVFEIDEAQHAEMQRLRGNLYDLVHYVRSIDRLYVINHLTWTAQRRVLRTWQIEKLLELFDVFEGINGTRSFAHNAFAWAATAGRGKTLVAGSDSHSNRVGTTYTLTRGADVHEAIRSIRAGDAAPCGAFGTPEKLAEDVWLVLHQEIERRLAAAGSSWERLTCRGVRLLGRLTYPLVCQGYHRRQNVLINDFLRALPA